MYILLTFLNCGLWAVVTCNSKCLINSVLHCVTWLLHIIFRFAADEQPGHVLRQHRHDNTGWRGVQTSHLQCQPYGQLAFFSPLHILILIFCVCGILFVP